MVRQRAVLAIAGRAEPADISNVDGVPIVTPFKAILDGLERHLDGRLIGQAIDSAARRGLITSDEAARLGAVPA